MQNMPDHCAGAQIKLEVHEEDIDVKPVEDEIHVFNEPFPMDNDDINEMPQSTNKLPIASTADELKNIKLELQNVNRKLQNLTKKQDYILQEQRELKVAVTKMNLLLKMSLGIKTDEFAHLFPLHDEESLQLIEDQLQSEKRQSIITLMRKLICSNIVENFSKIFSDKLIFSHNYEGIQNKKPIKIYESFLLGLFEASELQTHEEFVMSIRSSFKINKNRIHKRRSRQINKTSS
ncbi:uncharacterized protein LOC111593167 [Drosophila hydei]|uniref:Uncharacterized protein LOC111593167 n=1 Tax=Drosophila hydei TaxID=7224 RepID=A0A6J1LB93_DROHY|nr:uncharacterized protein LOC111593167 [Drosophila hydei]